ncbi:MAG: TolC family protein, partial [bacterium]|nr:TolC family protein [bacterium]
MMKFLRNCIFVLLAAALVLVFMPGYSYAEGETGFSLADAIKRGLENNFDIRVARQSLEIARNNNSWGAAGRYPTLDLGVNFNNSLRNSASDSMPGERENTVTNTLTPNVNLRWVLFNGFSIKITRAKLAHLNDISEGNAAIAVENTIQAIVLAYYKVLLEQEKLKVLEQVRKLSRDRFDYIEDRKDVGAAATYDVLQTKIAWLDDKSNVLLQAMNVKSALRNLNLVLGEPAEKEFQPTETFGVQRHEYRLSDLLGKLRSGNKTLKNQYINQAILKKDIALQRSALYPSVSLNSGVNRIGSRLKLENIPAINSSTYDYYVNFSVSLNLFNGGNTKRAIANAKIQEKIGQLEIEELELTLSNVLSTTFDLYNVRKQLYTVSEEKIKSARLNLDISDEKFKSGAINSFNYR